MVAIVVAFTRNRVIGRDNGIPWKLPADMRHFRNITIGSTVIMGRNTYNSLLNGLGGPLPERRNIVISSTLDKVASGFELAISLDEALNMSNAESEDLEVFIIGGARLYAAVLDKHLVDNLYLTEIDAEIEGDTFFPPLQEQDWLEISRKQIPKDDKNAFDMSFLVMSRNRGSSSSINLD